MDTETSAVARRQLPPLPTSVSRARKVLRDHLSKAGDAPVVEHLDDAELLISEVVTNAVVHAATPVDVIIRTVDRARLRVEVGDGSPHFPTIRSYAAMSGTGRGLRMLEKLAVAWGVTPRDGGKVVWFELGGATTAPGTQGGLPTELPSEHIDERGVGHAVRLLGVPLLLHAAWQAHAEALLREYLLVRLDGADAVEALEAHAAANDAMALLREQIPHPALAGDPEALMAEATEPLVTAGEVVVRVPDESLANFELLGRDLDAAARLAEQGKLLTFPTQPEVRMLRRWMVQEVLAQAAGRPPSAWDGAVDPRRTTGPRRTDTELTDVTDATTARLAADDTNQILAVSAPALALLGYERAGELVGQRLVAIIPPRYHQAHLAGFTLHLAEGRAPLLDAPVVVPALRRDGSEVGVRLTVAAGNLSDGGRLFVAELERA